MLGSRGSHAMPNLIAQRARNVVQEVGAMS